MKLISLHKQYLYEYALADYKVNRIKSETLQILKHKLTEKIEDLLNSDDAKAYINQVVKRSLDPYSMADLIIKLIGKEKNS